MINLNPEACLEVFVLIFERVPENVVGVPYVVVEIVRHSRNWVWDGCQWHCKCCWLHLSRGWTNQWYIEGPELYSTSLACVIHPIIVYSCNRNLSDFTEFQDQLISYFYTALLKITVNIVHMHSFYCNTGQRCIILSPKYSGMKWTNDQGIKCQLGITQTIKYDPWPLSFYSKMHIPWRVWLPLCTTFMGSTMLPLLNMPHLAPDWLTGENMRNMASGSRVVVLSKYWNVTSKPTKKKKYILTRCR